MNKAINVSFRLQVLLFKNMSIGTILTAFSLADLYGKGLADCQLDLADAFCQQFEQVAESQGLLSLCSAQ